MAKEQTIQYKDLILERIKQNYQSVILGALVIFVGISVFVRLISQPKKLNQISSNPDTESAQKIENKKEVSIKNYTVKKGENLWLIAENVFGSGYNAFDIAKVNKIKNPNLIETGQKLIIPQVEAKKPTKGLIAQGKTAEIKFKEDKYTIKSGDYLWKIALEAYGDGYQWNKIAKANKLVNPEIIHAGNVLIIPRE